MKKHTYDDNGNMSSKVFVKCENTTETQFTYDGFDRTTGIKIGDVTTSFDYNTDSDRVSKTTNGKTTESILDNDSVSADLIGETLKVFTEDNSVFCQNGVFSYNVINTKGDIIASDGSNGIDYNYNAYGTELYNCSSANPIGYRNYYYDSETGLYYLKARYYDPTTGQFTQEDTVQDDNLQYNLYGYCSANPVLYTDADGHKKINKNMLTHVKKATSGRINNRYGWTVADVLRVQRVVYGYWNVIVPPQKYAPNNEWSYNDLIEFLSFEDGNTLSWKGCTSGLMKAKAKFEKKCKNKGWRLQYTSAYRPLIYQAHFYDLVYGSVSKTTNGKNDRQRHGLSNVVSRPNGTVPHTKGIAFDCTVRTKSGAALNSKKSTSGILQNVANECGLRNDITGDYVHFLLR